MAWCVAVARWTLAAAAQAGTLCRRVCCLFALVNVVLKICLGTIFRYEPVVAYETQLDDIWACPFGVLVCLKLCNLPTLLSLQLLV